MADEFEKGDKVEWNAHGGKSSAKGKAEGTVVKKLTSETEIKGHKVKASKDDPQYVVESDKSGNEAVHKPGALKKA